MSAKKSVFDNPVLSTKVKSANVKIVPEALMGYLVGPFCGLLANTSTVRASLESPTTRPLGK